MHLGDRWVLIKKLVSAAVNSCMWMDRLFRKSGVEANTKTDKPRTTFCYQRLEKKYGRNIDLIAYNLPIDNKNLAYNNHLHFGLSDIIPDVL